MLADQSLREHGYRVLRIWNHVFGQEPAATLKRFGERRSMNTARRAREAFTEARDPSPRSRQSRERRSSWPLASSRKRARKGFGKPFRRRWRSRYFGSSDLDGDPVGEGFVVDDGESFAAGSLTAGCDVAEPFAADSFAAGSFAIGSLVADSLAVDSFAAGGFGAASAARTEARNASIDA